MNKRAVLYARVSTDESAEKGYSLPSQLAACREYATRNDLEVITELQDDYSGAKLDRPALNVLRDMIARREVDAVIVYSSDRWTRNLAHSLLLREELQRAGVAFHLVNRGEVDDTPEDRMTGNIEAVFNEYWREKIIEACKRGRDSKAKAGRVVGCGKPPYGYDYVDGALVPNPSEAAVVELIYRLYVSGDGDGKPLVDYAIARKLSEIGIPCPGERNGGGPKRLRDSGMWSPGTVRRLLISKTYTGVLYYGENCIAVPQLIPMPVWTAAQQRREHNKRMSPRKTIHEYLLRGMITCACGNNFGGSNRDSYRCTQRINHHRGLETICDAPIISSSFLDTLVWDYILAELQTDHFEQNLRVAQQADNAALQAKQEQVSMLAHRLTQCEREAGELTHALRAVPPDGIMSKTLQASIAELERRYAGLKKEYAEAQAAMGNTLTDDDMAALMQFREDVILGIENATFEDKRQAVEMLQVKVLIHDRKASVTCRIQPQPVVFDLHSLGEMV